MAEGIREFLEARIAAREAHTRRERHGVGELVRLDGVPTEAHGCLAPGGTPAEATCLTRQKGLADAERVWMRALAPGSPLHRRGRLLVEPGVALRFVDEPDADVPVPAAAPPAVPDMERDMLASPRLRERARGSELFAGLLYAALCNNEWRHVATGQVWSQSFRSNGGTVASLRGGESYMDWYCWGHEGTADEQVLAELRQLGWELLPERDPASRRGVD